MEEAFSLIRERRRISQCGTRFYKLRLGQCAVGGGVGDGGDDMSWRRRREAVAGGTAAAFTPAGVALIKYVCVVARVAKLGGGRRSTATISNGVFHSHSSCSECNNCLEKLCRLLRRSHDQLSARHRLAGPFPRK